MALAKIVARLVDGGSFELHGDGTQSRSFTYVDDAVEATILALERGAAGDVFNVGGGEEASMLDAIETLRRSPGARSSSYRGRVARETRPARSPTPRVCGR